MGVSKVTLNGETLMDITSDTVNQNNLLSGQYAHGANGESIIGNYQPTIYNIATETEDGLMSSEDKRKLNEIAENAGINQNAFSHIKIGDAIISADNETDTLTLAAGRNVTLTPSASNDSVTISVNGLGSAAAASLASTVQNNQTVPTGAAIRNYLIESGYTSNEGTVTKVSTGAGLKGGNITNSGTIKADLLNQTRLKTEAIAAAFQMSGRVYPVALDKNGKLAVNVPWENLQPVTGVKGDAESTYRTGNINIDKSNIGLGKVENKSSKDIREELTQENVTAALGFIPYTPEEVNNLITSADLDSYLKSISIAGQNLTPSSNAINALQLSNALGLGNAAYRSVEDIIDSDDNIPTGAAVQNYIAGLGYTRNTGTITKITAGDGLTGGDITTSGTISLAESGVSGGSAGPTAATEGQEGVKISIPRITVDRYGRVTALSSYDLTNKNTTYKSEEAVLDGTDVSLVTTGEKYLWNDKISRTIIAQTSDIEF